MSVLVRIPTPLRPLAGGQSELSEEGTSVKEILDNLITRFPAMRERMMDESGELRRFINIYVNEEDIRFREGVATPISPGDEVSIIPAIAWGA